MKVFNPIGTRFALLPGMVRKATGLVWVLWVGFAFLASTNSWATHIRAGEIKATRQQSPQGLTYEFTLFGYTDAESPIIFAQGMINFGDGSDPRQIDQLAQEQGGEIILDQDLGNLVEFNKVVVTHTFPAPGRYTISYIESNRNADILNMDNSVNTPFYIETQIIIDPLLGPNNSPVLLVPPIDEGAVGTKFLHNSGAYDIDGDSLSYMVVIPKQDRDLEVSNYVFPNDPKFGGTRQDGGLPTVYSLDALTGDVLWDAPGMAGEYNIAFIVEEWRVVGGQTFRMGYVTRDMQIIIKDSENEPPELTVPEDICVVAGDTVDAIVSAIDPNNQDVILEAFGGSFEQVSSPSTFQPDPPAAQPIPAVGFFHWETNCSHVRERPYQVVFKASDVPPPGPILVDFKTWNIQVVAPAPVLTSAEIRPFRTISLEWEPYNFCTPYAQRMQIWRRVDSYSFESLECVTGIPSEAGYELIATLDITETSFLDNNFGQGLDFGANYCYRLVATFPFPGGGESFASNEVCNIIEAKAPVITNVTVPNPPNDTDEANGRLEVRWTKPFNLDQLLFPPPYKYDVLIADGLTGDFNLRSALPAGVTITDTSLLIDNLNTLNVDYNLRICTTDDNGTSLDTSSIASMVRLNPITITGGVDLIWGAKVPWSNRSQRFPYHYILRDNVDPNDVGKILLIDSVDVNINGFLYEDRGQFNGVPLSDQLLYCYYVVTSGTYGNPEIREPLLNNSQMVCVQPNDTVAPCPPVAFVVANQLDCEQFLNESTCDFDDFFNELEWEIDDGNECQSDIRTYIVYYSDTGEEGSYKELVRGVTGTRYVDEGLSSFARCYRISSVDRSNNISERSEPVCNDNCPFYELPNVFTPNGDNINDTFRAFDNEEKCSRFVESVIFRVVNRYGKPVFNFNSEDANSETSFLIDWDGKSDSGTPLASGMYYYEAEVKFDVLDPNANVTKLNGWIHLRR